MMMRSKPAGWIPIWPPNKSTMLRTSHYLSVAVMASTGRFTNYNSDAFVIGN